MNNGSATEATNGHDPVEPAAASLTLTTTGYCAGCGTWDTHALTCNTCGYDFGGTPIADARA